ncbi:7434_t:CDS:2 [Rhizophagus irregularis]|nr:7434_t:CDS:2 [Rhizophagus irregularis]
MSNKISSTSHSNKVPRASHSNKVSNSNASHPNKVSNSNASHPNNKVSNSNASHPNKVSNSNASHPNKVSNSNASHPNNKVSNSNASHPNKVSSGVSIFIDNSSILFEGTYTVGRIENASAYDQRRRSVYLNELKIDYGRLLSRALHGREICNNPTIVGIQPPKEDSLWNYVQSLGYKVIFHAYKERLSYTISTFTIAVMNTIQTKDPGTMIIISSDDNYNPLAKEALKRGWEVETWSWMKGAFHDYNITVDEKSRYTHNYLGSHYKYFTCAYTDKMLDHPHTKYVLEINYTEEWNDKHIMEFYSMLELFGWWCRDKISKKLFLYFGSRKSYEKAKQQLRIKYPHIIQLDVHN